MFAWFLILPIVAVAMGAIIILQGSMGRLAYYQLKGARHGGQGTAQMAGETLRRRQLHSVHQRDDGQEGGEGIIVLQSGLRQ